MLKADCKACIYMHVVCVLWEGIFSIYSIIRNGILSRITASLIQEIAVLVSVARVISSCGGTVTPRCPAGLRTQARWQEEEDNVNWADMGSIRPPFSPSPCLMMITYVVTSTTGRLPSPLGCLSAELMSRNGGRR